MQSVDKTSKRALSRLADEVYLTTPPAIIDAEIWDKVQSGLQAASAKQRGASAGHPVIGAAPLKGKFQDETGDLLTPTHTQRHGKRLRYYISNRLVSGGPDPTAWRLPAPAFETMVARAMADHLEGLARRHQVLSAIDVSRAASASEALAVLAARLRSDVGAAAALVVRGTIGGGNLSMELDAAALASALHLPAGDLNPATVRIEAPFTCRRRGNEMKLVAGDRKPEPDPVLIRGLRNAHHWGSALKSGTPLAKLAAREAVSERYMARVIPLATLSPRIQSAILLGDQPGCCQTNSNSSQQGQ